MAGEWEPERRSGELEELERASGRRAIGWRLLAGTFIAGVAAALGLGFGTGMFDGGPTELDVSAAYLEGSEAGAAEAEADWEAETARLVAEADQRGRAYAETQIGDELIIGGRASYNYEAGLEAGLLMLEREAADGFREGWAAGYADGYESATGEAPELVPPAPEWESEGGGRLRQ